MARGNNGLLVLLILGGAGYVYWYAQQNKYTAAQIAMTKQYLQTVGVANPSDSDARKELDNQVKIILDRGKQNGQNFTRTQALDMITLYGWLAILNAS